VVTTTLEITGVGAGVDGIVAALKSVAARFGAESELVKTLGTAFRRWADNSFSDQFEFKALVEALAANDEFMTSVNRFFRSADDAVAMEKNLLLHGERFIEGFLPLLKAGTYSEGAFRAANKVLANLPTPRARELLLSSTEEGGAALAGLVKALDHGIDTGKGLDAGVLQRVVENPYLFAGGPNATQATVIDLFKNLGDVADHCPDKDGFVRLVRDMQRHQSSVIGSRYEIDFAADLARQGEELQFLRKFVGRNGTKGWTDIDVVAGGVLYDLKSSLSAVKKLGVTDGRKFQRWCAKVLAEASAQGKNALEVRLVVPDNGCKLPGIDGSFRGIREAAFDKGVNLNVVWRVFPLK
jgi:hypothetical protein